MSYPASYRLPRTSTTGPKVLTFVGIAVLALSLGIGAAAFLNGVWGARTIENARSGPRVYKAAIVTVQPGQTGTATLDADTPYSLWPRKDVDADVPRPDVTSPTGTTISVYTHSSGNFTSITQVVIGWHFVSQDVGTYEITTDVDSPALQLVADDPESPTTADGVFQVFGAVVFGTVAFGLPVVGLPLTVGGAVWWSSRAKSARQATVGQQV